MDPWLTNVIKELLFEPCLGVSASVGRRLDNRIRMGQEIDERALTEFLVDSLDTSSSENVWGNTIAALRDHSIYLSTSVTKSTLEHKTGADIGFVINRSVHQSGCTSKTQFAALVQCKKIDSEGNVGEFFHESGPSRAKQSTLMLDISPSSYYFIFTPPSLVHTYCSIEPIGFAQVRPGCSSAVWNSGSFEFDQNTLSYLSSREKSGVVGILVVPALAVEAQRSENRNAHICDVLPNCLPLWYWFGELLIPGFIGDRRSNVIAVASNVRERRPVSDNQFGVRNSINVSLGNG